MRIFVASVMNEVEMVFEGEPLWVVILEAALLFSTIKEARFTTGFLRHNP